MPDLTKILTVYLVTINVATFFVYGLDKWKAKLLWLPSPDREIKKSTGTPVLLCTPGGT